MSEALAATSIWSVASVQEEPETVLTQWRVMQVDGDSIHFVGNAGYEGRVCSAVQSYDPSTRRGVTLSGRVYELHGDSGYNSDAMYVWARWRQINNISDSNVVDVTSHYE